MLIHTLLSIAVSTRSADRIYRSLDASSARGVRLLSFCIYCHGVRVSTAPTWLIRDHGSDHCAAERFDLKMEGLTQVNSTGEGCGCENGGICQMTLPHIPVCICPPEFSGELCEHMPVSHNMWAYVIGIPVVMVSVVLIFVAAAVVYYFRTTWKGRGEAYDPAPTSALRTMVAAGGNNSLATGTHRVSYVEDRVNILAAEELG